MSGLPELLNQRRWLETGLLEAYREADKLIVTVSSAVLALSVAFVGQVKNPENTQAITCSWSLFLAAITMVLLSLVLEQREREARIAKIDKAILANAFDHRDLRLGWGILTGILNILGVAAFILAFVQLVSFLSANLT